MTTKKTTKKPEMTLEQKTKIIWERSRKRVKQHSDLTGGNIGNIVSVLVSLGGVVDVKTLADEVGIKTKTLRRKMQDFGLAKDRNMNLVSPCGKYELILHKNGIKSSYEVKPL